MNIAVQNLVFSYGKKTVLNGLDFACKDGQVVGLLGENGSGKSTLLGCLAGLHNTGTVLWDGKLTERFNTESKAKMRAIVTQQMQFDPNMTLYDFVILGRTPWFRWVPRTEDENMVMEMLDFFELSHLAFRPLSHISGGERQKAALSRAFVQDVPLILLDEPLNNLDMRFQIKCMQFFKQQSAQKGSLIIAVLHDINAALRWCDWAILLKDGRIIADGDVQESINEESLSKMLDVSVSFHQVDGVRIVVPSKTQSPSWKEPQPGNSG